MLWLQPIHPRGIEGRQFDPSTKKPFALGSPYAVKNFFEVMPLLAKNVSPTGTPAQDDTLAGRIEAMKQFQHFVRAADKAGVGVMLDAPFNHTAHDVELAANGQKYWATNRRLPQARFGTWRPGSSLGRTNTTCAPRTP